MKRETVKRKLTAVLHADVKDYSRLMGDDEVDTVRTLTEYRELMMSLVDVYRGRLVDTAGDGFLVEFASVVDAVGCAVELQQELGVRNEDLPDHRKMKFRIGINIGEVIEEGDQIFGDGVNIAARLEGLAEPGGICISGTAYDQLKQKLALTYEYMGERSVKNIADPVRAYRVRMEGEDDTKVEASGERLKQRRWQRPTILVLAVLLAVVAAAAIWRFYLGSSYAIKTNDVLSIAVLPFVNKTGNPEHEYFSDGVTDEITAGLAHIPDLIVIAHNSTFAFKGKQTDVKEAAKRLGVRYVVEGEAGTNGKRFQITTRLTDAHKGTQLWSGRYEKGITDVFAVEDEIKRRIVSILHIKFQEDANKRLTGSKQPTQSIEAYEKFLQGMRYYYQGDRNGNASARGMFEQAIAQDSGFARAYGALAWSHLIDAKEGWTGSRRESMRTAFKMAKKAVSLDESSVTGRRTLSRIYLRMGRYDSAVTEAERAVTLRPGDAEANATLGLVLTFAGRPKEAIPILKQAILLNPIPAIQYYQMLGHAYIGTAAYDNAITAYGKALQGLPESIWGRLGLIAAYALAGRIDDARSNAAQFLRFRPGFSLNYVTKKMPYKNPADLTRFVDALRKAGMK